jgi:hypothetical protein
MDHGFSDEKAHISTSFPLDQSPFSALVDAGLFAVETRPETEQRLFRFTEGNQPDYMDSVEQINVWTGGPAASLAMMNEDEFVEMFQL